MNVVNTEQRVPRAPRHFAILQEVFEGSAAFCDAMPVAVCMCDDSGQVVRFNARAAALWGGAGDPAANFSDSSAYRFFGLDGELIAEADTPVMTVLSTGQELHDAAFVLERADRSRTTVMCNARPVRDEGGRIVGAIVCLQDVSALAPQRHADTYENAGIGIAEVDIDGRFLRVNEALTAITGYSRAELMKRHIFDPKYSEDAARDRVNYRQQVTGGYDRYTLEKRIKRKDGSPIWLHITSTSVRDSAGKFLYGIRVVQDITDSKRSEERNKALLGELDHRLKNTLATVQTLAAHSFRDAGVPEDVLDAFESRLGALGRAHEQLMRERWESADLDLIARQILAPFRTPSTTVRIEGCPLKLRPQPAVTIGFVLHELAINAARHGALSIAGGTVDLRWGLTEQRALRLEWRESGGPVVRQPERRGFGSRLLEWGIVLELKGGVNVRYEPSGFSCRIEIPLATIAA